jgi:hypothetical protein
MFEDLTSEMEYRGWIKSRYEYMRKCWDVFAITKELERSSVKILSMNINQVSQIDESYVAFL